jgi:hypothetical protein
MEVVTEYRRMVKISLLSAIRNCRRDKETGEVLFEITEDGEKQVLSRGGKEV